MRALTRLGRSAYDIAHQPFLISLGLRSPGTQAARSKWSRTSFPPLYCPRTFCIQRPILAVRPVIRKVPSLRTLPRARAISSYSNCSTVTRPNPVVHQSSASSISLAAAVALAAAALYLLFSGNSGTGASSEEPQPLSDDMAVEIPPGRPGNLTPEQEEGLRQLWARLFQIWGMAMDEPPAEPAGQPSEPGKVDKEKKKKKRSLFSRKNKDPESATDSSKAAASDVAQSVDSKDDKFGQTKVFLDAMASHSPEELRAMVWTMVKHDDPDALLLRFLRARKWDIEKALVMLISTLDWRKKEVHVDDDILMKGELAALEGETSSDPKVKQASQDFMAQLRMGKSFMHGTDNAGRPVCIVRTHLHRQGEHSEESLERATVFIIETTRFLLDPPVDTATIVFDMTHFSMANMDYAPVKFIIKVFEANYPESLGSVLVHKAPWVFQGIWRIIRGWLDPVVAAKVHFTNNLKELDEFIPRSRLLKELDGEEDWEYSYKEPVPGENDTMKDTATRDKIVAAREQLIKEYEEVTMEWLHNPEGEQTQGIKTRRSDIVKRLRESYWQLDPYIRARSLYDRIGMIGPGGKLNFAAETTPSVAAAPQGQAASANGTTAETSADDVD